MQVAKDKVGTRKKKTKGGSGTGRQRLLNNDGKDGCDNSDGSSGVPMCRFFRRGMCAKGSACRYRHTQTKEEVAVNTGKRRLCFDPFKAAAIDRAKAAQDVEPSSFWVSSSGPFYGLDVECVATGFGHSETHRIAARIALVDSSDRVLLDQIVHPAETPVVSYLTPLTGLTADSCLEHGRLIEQVLSDLKNLLPTNAILVGQSIEHDIHWLGLQKGIDFMDSVDISLIFHQRIPKNLNSAANTLKRFTEEKEFSLNVMNTIVDDAIMSTEDVISGDPDKCNPLSVPPVQNHILQCNGSSFDNNKVDTASCNVYERDVIPFPTRYRVFSLRHCCIHLFGTDIQSSIHDPVRDATYSLSLFHRYRKSTVSELRIVRDALHRAPVTPSFAVEMPLVDGVCLTRGSYRYKWAGRFIWKWWLSRKTTRSTTTH